MPRDLSKLTAAEKEALKAKKKAYDAERQKEVYQEKKERKAQGLHLIAPPPPAYKSGMRSDYEENYGDFEPNYKVALADAKAQDYDIDEWKEAWDEEHRRRKRGIPEDVDEGELTEFAPWHHLLRNRFGDILTRDYEWVGKLVIKIKGGKPSETIKRVSPPAYLVDTSLGTITEERFAKILEELTPQEDSLAKANREHSNLTVRLRKEAETKIFGHPLTIQEKVERQRADEVGYARLEDKALKLYWELMAKARPVSKINLIETDE